MPAKSSAEARIHPVINQTKLLALMGYNLRRASMRLARAYGKPMKKLGLRPAEFATLVLLQDNAGTSQKSLARSLAMDPPNMATLLDRLGNRRLVQRLPHPRDARPRQLPLTTLGRALTKRAAQAVVLHERKAVAVLSAEEKVQLIQLLGKLVADEL